MNKSIIAAVIVTTALTGCKSTLFKTKVQGLYTVPAFTYQSINESKIAIGGIVYSGNENNRFNTSILQIQDFENQIRNERPNFTVVPAVSLKQSIPNDTYQQVMEEYKTSNTLRPASLQILAEHNYPRYVVFTNILADRIANARSEFEAKEKVNGVKIKVKKVKSETDRNISAQTHIFDLQSATLVWSGSVNKSKSAYKYYVKNRSSQAIVQLAQALSGENNMYPFPEPAPLDDVMSYVFEGVAENLPEAPEKS